MGMDQSVSTITSVAKEAGVSIATVSRVINNPSLVASETRQRVLKVIQARNFRISKEAQLTRRRHRALRTGRIGFLVPNLPHRSTESITEEMCKGIQKALGPRGMEMVLHYYDYDAEPLDAMPRMLRENSVDGILTRPPSNRATLVEFCRYRKAVVVGNTFADLDIPCVIADDWAGMRMILDYLHELGHRRIAFVGNTLTSILNLRRLQAYRSWMEDHGQPHDERLIKIHDAWVVNAEDSQKLCRRFLDELLALDTPPTAIAAATDGFAAELLLAARERSVKVPDQLSITGFGDQYYAPLTDPPLTTVHIDQRATGEIGATLLLQLIEGASYSAQTLVRPTFVERRSCAVTKQKV
jgi:DNA-binding LacI/PurR family transcriptional regulator